MIIKIKDDIQNAYLRQNSARINCDNAKEKMGSTLSDFDALREEVSVLKLDLDSLEKQKKDKEDELSTFIKNEENEKKLIDEKQKELVLLRNDETSKLQVVSDIHLVMEKLYQKQEFEQSNLVRLNADADRIVKDKEELLSSRNLSDEDIEIKRANLVFLPNI